MLVLSWLGAIVACLGYGVSSVLQSVAAKRSAEVVGLTGIVLIIKQVPYLLGLAADTAAFAGNVLALQRLPLFLVQSIVAGSVGVTAVIASLRGARLSWKDWASLAILGLGLVLLCVTAVPTAATQIPLVDDWIILLASIAPLVVGLIGFRMKNRASAIVMSCAAGLGFSGVALASRGIGAAGISWSLLSDPLLWAIIVHGVDRHWLLHRGAAARRRHVGHCYHAGVRGGRSFVDRHHAVWRFHRRWLHAARNRWIRACYWRSCRC